MKSLFAKIFLWFWVAVTFSSMALAVLALTQVGPAARHHRQIIEERRRLMGQALVFYGEAAMETFHRGGAPALSAYLAQLQKQTGIKVFLFAGDEKKSLSGDLPPEEIAGLAGKAAESGQAVSSPDESVYELALPVSMPGGDFSYTVAGEWPGPLFRQSRLWFPLRREFGMQLAIYLVVGGAVCYGLAWHLTAPIRRMSGAARRLAGGDLSARVGEKNAGRKDELAELGRDFDQMAERIEALIKSQRRLLRDISHELRSPLARLNVALELARRSSGPDTAGQLDRIELESERLNDLIAQLVTMTMLESGTEVLEKTSVDLCRLVRDIAADADFEARSEGRTVNVRAEEGIFSVSGSVEMLRRAIENVVRNAVRHTATGTAVEIGLAPVVKNAQRFALVSVRDHGPGVPEKALSQIFHPFYRVADARERQSGGAGIGLAITERAVLLHGGVVAAANAADGGLIVRIELPLA